MSFFEIRCSASGVSGAVDASGKAMERAGEIAEAAVAEGEEDEEGDTEEISAGAERECGDGGERAAAFVCVAARAEDALKAEICGW